jgi:hypothetical protein
VFSKLGIWYMEVIQGRIGESAEFMCYGWAYTRHSLEHTALWT